MNDVQNMWMGLGFTGTQMPTPLSVFWTNFINNFQTNFFFTLKPATVILKTGLKFILLLLVV